MPYDSPHNSVESIIKNALKGSILIENPKKIVQAIAYIDMGFTGLDCAKTEDEAVMAIKIARGGIRTLLAALETSEYDYLQGYKYWFEKHGANTKVKKEFLSILKPTPAEKKAQASIAKKKIKGF